MKAGILLTLAMALIAGRTSAQQANTLIEQTNATSLSFDAATSPYLNPDLQSKGSEVSVGKNLHARGPLIHIFHVSKPGEVPKRFWHLINPFSRSERKSETEVIHSRDLSPRAWTTVAGWHPGVSSYANSLTQPEGGGGIGLVSIEH